MPCSDWLMLVFGSGHPNMEIQIESHVSENESNFLLFYKNNNSMVFKCLDDMIQTFQNEFARGIVLSKMSISIYDVMTLRRLRRLVYLVSTKHEKNKTLYPRRVFSLLKSYVYAYPMDLPSGS